MKRAATTLLFLVATAAFHVLWQWYPPAETGPVSVVPASYGPAGVLAAISAIGIIARRAEKSKTPKKRLHGEVDGNRA